MVDVFRSGGFDKWLTALGDIRAQARIEVRIERLAAGNPGDVRPVGAGSANCASTMAPATVSISSGVAIR